LRFGGRSGEGLAVPGVRGVPVQPAAGAEVTVFLLTLELITPDGEILDSETLPIEVSPLYGFEKGITALGMSTTLRATFDPPLEVAAT
jgi:hypothetical protein